MVAEPEVCQWGLLARESSTPTYNICVIVAVALKDLSDLRRKGAPWSETSTSTSSGYSNYDCATIPIGNMPELGVNDAPDAVDGKYSQRGLICPQFTINDSTVREPVTLKRFLLADGDHDQNSVFVFGFSGNTFEEMDIMFYMSGIFRINLMTESSPSVSKFQRATNNLQRELDLSDLCNVPIEERQKICKFVAMKRFLNKDGQLFDLGPGFDLNAMHLDRSGFVPYRCFKRYTAVLYSSNEEMAVHVGPNTPEDHIYCPGHAIKIGNSTTAQSGFFYTVTSHENEKRIRTKDTIPPVERIDHKVGETSVIPIPMRR